jgi:excisionase family DNA binding protein
MKTSQTVAQSGVLTEPRSRSASLLRTSSRSSASSGTAPKTDKAAVSVSVGAPIKQKRVRLKPESRDQLLERLRNPQLSLHEASILLRVSRATVRRYADAGRLQCLRTPGGQRRFYLRDIELFYRQLKMRR